VRSCSLFASACAGLAIGLAGAGVLYLVAIPMGSHDIGKRR
jgi:hypothetical protein